jgi:hypothetical protein
MRGRGGGGCSSPASVGSADIDALVGNARCAAAGSRLLRRGRGGRRDAVRESRRQLHGRGMPLQAGPGHRRPAGLGATAGAYGARARAARANPARPPCARAGRGHDRGPDEHRAVGGARAPLIGRVRPERRALSTVTGDASISSQRADETRGAVMKIFAAGATGVLGRALVPQLVPRGHEVIGMTKSASTQDLVRSLGARPVVADALDPDAIAQAVASAEPEVIVHQLTALSGPMSVREARHHDRSFAATMTNRLRTEATDHLLAAGGAVLARRFVAQSFAGLPIRPHRRAGAQRGRSRRSQAAGGAADGAGGVPLGGPGTRESDRSAPTARPTGPVACVPRDRDPANSTAVTAGWRASNPIATVTRSSTARSSQARSARRLHQRGRMRGVPVAPVATIAPDEHEQRPARDARRDVRCSS